MLITNLAAVWGAAIDAMEPPNVTPRPYHNGDMSPSVGPRPSVSKLQATQGQLLLFLVSVTITVNNGISKKAATDDVIIFPHTQLSVDCCLVSTYCNHDSRYHLPATIHFRSSADRGIHSSILGGLNWRSCSAHKLSTSFYIICASIGEVGDGRFDVLVDPSAAMPSTQSNTPSVLPEIKPFLLLNALFCGEATSMM